MSKIFAYNNKENLLFRWSGFRDRDGWIEDKQKGINIPVGNGIFRSGYSSWLVGVGNKDFYEGHYLLAAKRGWLRNGKNEYSFWLLNKEGVFASGGLKGDLIPHYSGFEASVLFVAAAALFAAFGFSSSFLSSGFLFGGLLF